MSWESKPNLVTAIIPAYNEEGRVGKVVSTACQVNYLRDIIVVDDGSSDASAQEAVRAARGDPRLRVIRHPKNMGKGRALFTGWREARTPYLIMLDADLLNLKPEHIEALIEPVLCGEADMTVGLFVHGQYFSDAAHWFTPWLSGQRCLHTDMLQHISPRCGGGLWLRDFAHPGGAPLSLAHPACAATRRFSPAWPCAARRVGTGRARNFRCLRI